MASPNLSEIVTTTLRNRSKTLADNVSANNALLFRLRQRGNRKPVSGGTDIIQELEYAENSTFMWYSGYEALDVSPSDVFTSAVFDWKQAAVTVSISGLEGDVQNTGPDRIIDLLESRIKNAERTMMNNISVGVYSLGTASGGKQIGGLQLLVATDPSSGIIGGINRQNWSFWRNQRFRASSDGLLGDTSAGNIYRYMTRTYLLASRGRDQPDLVISDNNFFAHYMASLQDKQRFTDPKLADAGFQNVKFMGADVVFDGGISGDCPSNTMYFLNTNYIFYRPHKDRDMVPLETRVSLNQDATVKPLVWAGNMTMSNAQLQAVMYND